MTDQRPIDCGLHSEYELAVMHSTYLRITWHQPDGQPQVDILIPRDLQTGNHEEFLIAEQADGQRLHLRLDASIKTEAV